MPDLLSILCVDDDADFLEQFRGRSWKEFRPCTAVGSTCGLDAVAQDGPFAVVIAALRMAPVSGTEFLAQIHSRAPEAVQILAADTGDIAAAVTAANEKDVFRVLVKNCTPAVFEKTLGSALRQHELVIKERLLKHQALVGCVEMLTEILHAAYPDAIGVSMRIWTIVQHLNAAFQLDKCAAEFEAAAMLFQIERLLPRAGATATCRMLEKIPGLQGVAAMVEQHRKHFCDFPLDSGDGSPRLVALGAQMLRAAIDFDELHQTGIGPEEAVKRMRLENGLYNPDVVRALADVAEGDAFYDTKVVPLDGLRPGMILREDIRATNGTCLLGRGQEITTSLLDRLLHFAGLVPPGDMWKVRTPRSQQRHVVQVTRAIQ